MIRLISVDFHALPPHLTVCAVDMESIESAAHFAIEGFRVLPIGGDEPDIALACWIEQDGEVLSFWGRNPKTGGITKFVPEKKV